MSNRGEYRTLFVSFGDDPDVHDLSGNGVKLLVLLKLALPPTGIGVVYPSMFAEKMRCALEDLELVFQEIEKPKAGDDRGWIARERNVVWIFNALRHEPNLMATNVKKHAPFVRRLVAELDPKLAIVRAFKSYYKDWFPDAPPFDWKGYRNPIDTLSHRVSEVSSDEDKTKGIDRVSHTQTIGNRNNSSSSSLTNQSRSRTSGDLSRESGSERAIAKLPPAAREFGRSFYGSAPPSRKRDVKRQLLATLNGGAQLRKGVKVTAGSVARLEAKCREVITEGVRDPDTAIVVLLTKLADVSDDSPTERAAAAQRAEEQRDETDTAQRLADAYAWIASDAQASADVDHLVDAELDAQHVARGPMREMTRRMLHRSAVLKRWTDAGEPVVAPAGGLSS